MEKKRRRLQKERGQKKGMEDLEELETRRACREENQMWKRIVRTLIKSEPRRHEESCHIHLMKAIWRSMSVIASFSLVCLQSIFVSTDQHEKEQKPVEDEPDLFYRNLRQENIQFRQVIIENVQKQKHVVETACRLHFLPVLTFLLSECHVDPQLPMWIACRFGNVELVRFLVEYHNVSFIGCPDFYVNSLDIACRNGHLEVVRYLLEENKVTHAQFEEITDIDGNSLFMLACQSQNLALVRYLSLVLSPEHVNFQNTKTGHTALMEACIRSHFLVVKFLVEEDFADIHVKDFKQQDALSHALQYSNIEIRLFLEPLLSPKSASSLQDARC